VWQTTSDGSWIIVVSDHASSWKNYSDISAAARTGDPSASLILRGKQKKEKILSGSSERFVRFSMMRISFCKKTRCIG